MIKMKTKICLFILAFSVFLGFLPKNVFAANCSEFSTAVAGSSVTVTINDCDTDGTYLLQIVKNNETLIADNVSVSAGRAQRTFHLSEKGTYLARLIFAGNIINQSGFVIENVSTLNCGDPCNPNDTNCPSKCPSTYVAGNWVCYLQPTVPPSGPSGPAINFNVFKDAIPSLNPVFQGGASNVGSIISLVLPYLFVIAGLLLLFYLIYGGFHMMIAANDEKGFS